MTTFQDPPPQSRRAVRQSERGDTPPQAPVEDAPYAFDAAQEAPETPQAPVAPPHSGRRAQQPATPTEDAGEQTPGFEPLTYSTQGRVSPPVAEQSQAPSLAAAPPPGSADPASFRVRDFSPEGGRRAAPHREPMTESPLAASASFPAPARAVDLDYKTQGVPPIPSHSAGSVPVEDTQNHTLSRRELREMRAAAEQEAPPLQMPSAQLPEPIDTLLNSGPIEIPTLAPPPGQSQALAEAMAEFDLLTRSRREAEARARDAQVASLATPIIPTQQQPVFPQAVAQPSAPQPPLAQASPFAELQPSAPQAPVAAAPLVFPPTASLPSPPSPAAQAPMLVEPVFLEPDVAPPQEEQSQEQDAHGGRSPRASNHWRVQAAMEDDELPYENTLSRTVGSNTSAITTSALVLPSVPQPDSMLGSLTSTGEILVTGSINLPRSLGSTGAHPDRVDNSDYEDDPFDSQVAAPDSAPVRAIRAISSNTSTRGVIETKKPQGNRMLTAIIVTAGVLAVGLVGILVFALATGKL
ncbi:MAG: hypothetical protein QOH69_2354 [Actinomycetota bacterium]|nr:hypothetical protein [Actinomycetota bacterium]